MIFPSLLYDEASILCLCSKSNIIILYLKEEANERNFSSHGLYLIAFVNLFSDLFCILVFKEHSFQRGYLIVLHIV